MGSTNTSPLQTSLQSLLENCYCFFKEFWYLWTWFVLGGSLFTLEFFLQNRPTFERESVAICVDPLIS